MSATAPSGTQSGTRLLLKIRPSDASSCISTRDQPSHAYHDPAAVQKNMLAVFLPGTGGVPAQFPGFLQRGAARGYHVIGLSYVNATSVNRTCQALPGNVSCAGAVREEVFSGRDASPLVAVGPADSIEGRLTALLRYLAFHRPRDGWSQFLDGGGAVDWSRVGIHGNSQGAGHAAFIAKVRSVARVGLYAGPSDWVSSGNRPVSWYTMPSKTPAAAFHGYVHVPDAIANVSGDPMQVLAVWGDRASFGMRGPVVDVASSQWPYKGSQKLTTRACAGMGTVKEHNCPMFRGNERVWDAVSFP